MNKNIDLMCEVPIDQPEIRNQLLDSQGRLLTSSRVNTQAEITIWTGGPKPPLQTTQRPTGPSESNGLTNMSPGDKKPKGLFLNKVTGPSSVTTRSGSQQPGQRASSSGSIEEASNLTTKPVKLLNLGRSMESPNQALKNRFSNFGLLQHKPKTPHQIKP